MDFHESKMLELKEIVVEDKKRKLVVPRGKFSGYIVEAASEIFRRPFLYNFSQPLSESFGLGSLDLIDRFINRKNTI